MSIDKYLSGSSVDKINMYLIDPHKYRDIFSNDKALNVLSNMIYTHLCQEIKPTNIELMNFILSELLNIKDIIIVGYLRDIYAVLNIDKPIKFYTISRISSVINSNNLYIAYGNICYNLHYDGIIRIDAMLFKSAVENYILDIYNIRSIMGGYDKHIFPDDPIQYLLFKLMNTHIFNSFLKSILNKRMIQITHPIQTLITIRHYIEQEEKNE